MLNFFRGGVYFITPPDIWGVKKQTMITMIFHKYLWLVWYEGMSVGTNGDQIPGAILSFMEEYLI